MRRQRHTETASTDEDAAEETPLVTPGDLLGGRYRIERVLGTGGMAVVHRAADVRLGGTVAIKTLRRKPLADAQLRRRFLQEGAALAGLAGARHIVRVLDTQGDEDAPFPYLVMEYLEGCDVGDELEERGPLSQLDAVRFALQACDALADAHAAGIVHRDVKPSNLFLTFDGDGKRMVKVVDFGIAKLAPVDPSTLTGSGSFIGSLPYSAPEQVKSARQADERSDVWSLGVTLYEMLTGHLPFGGRTPPDVKASVAQQAPVPPSKLRPELMVGLDKVVMACLEKDPDRRIPDVALLARRLLPFATADMSALVESIERRLAVPAPEVSEAPAALPPSPPETSSPVERHSHPPVSSRSTLNPAVVTEHEEEAPREKRSRRFELRAAVAGATAAVAGIVLWAAFAGTAPETGHAAAFGANTELRGVVANTAPRSPVAADSATPQDIAAAPTTAPSPASKPSLPVTRQAPSPPRAARIPASAPASSEPPADTAPPAPAAEPPPKRKVRLISLGDH